MLLYFQARLYHSAGLYEARNKSSLEFKTLEQTALLATQNNIPPTPIY